MKRILDLYISIASYAIVALMGLAAFQPPPLQYIGIAMLVLAVSRAVAYTQIGEEDK